MCSFREIEFSQIKIKDFKNMTAFSELDKFKVDALMDRAKHGWRTPVLRTPDSVGLKYEEVFFPSMDGVPIEGWFIPGNSNNLIICNHFWPGNRYGYAGHLEALQGLGGFEVNFLNYYKKLNEAGYNILTYDFRNHGLSGDGNGRTFGLGLFEYRDVIGSLNYAKSRADTKNMTIGLMSICLGCNSTFVGIEKYPEYFKDVKCILGLQPVSARPFLEKSCGLMNLEKPMDEVMDYIDKDYKESSGFGLDQLSPIEYAKSVKTPTKLFQLRRDFRTDPSDVQAVYDNLGSKIKELHWIEGASERFTAYNYFGEHPELMLEWFGRFMNK